MYDTFTTDLVLRRATRRIAFCVFRNFRNFVKYQVARAGLSDFFKSLTQTQQNVSQVHLYGPMDSNDGNLYIMLLALCLGRYGVPCH